jgi:hypothetical protein
MSAEEARADRERMWRDLQRLARKLAPDPDGSAPGAALIERVARDVTDAYAIRGRSKRSSVAERRLERCRAAHARALEELNHVTPRASVARTAEVGWMLANFLREAAEPLTREFVDHTDRHEAEVTAIDFARRNPLLSQVPDEELLGVLGEFAQDRNEQFGPGIANRRGLSADREAQLLWTILGGHSVGAFKAAMVRARRSRLEHYACDMRCLERDAADVPTVGTCSSDTDQQSIASSKGTA